MPNSRAEFAERCIRTRFLTDFLRIPGSLIAREHSVVQMNPGNQYRGHVGAFNYWWQAHLIDAFILSGQRHHRQGALVKARREAIDAHRLIYTLWIRNCFQIHNDFFDDMAWLALATHSLALFDKSIGCHLLSKNAHLIHRRLTRHLQRGLAAEGGMYWNTSRDFINAPATCPAALYFARAGYYRSARALMDWVSSNLIDPATELVIDGIHTNGDIETNLYTYNQATALAAYLELGSPDDLTHAEHIITGLSKHMIDPHSGVLRTHGNGDGGLFTGILAKYLARACHDYRLSSKSRTTASTLLHNLSNYLWHHRDPDRLFFSLPDSFDNPQICDQIDFSTQLQVWLIFESAETI